MNRFFFGATFSAIVLTGCASVPGVNIERPPSEFSYDERNSVALNVADSLGVEGLKDVPWDEYQALLEEHPELSEADTGGQVTRREGSLLGGAVAGTAGYQSPPTHLGSGAAGALGALSWLAGEPLRGAQRSRQVIWLPEGMTIEAFEEDLLRATLTVNGYNPEAMRKGRTEDGELYYALEGCEFGDESCSGWHRSVLYATNIGAGGRSGHRFTLPEAVDAPYPWMDQASSYQGPIFFTAFGRGLASMSKNEDVEGAYIALSGQMPEWYVHYHGRDLVTHRPLETPSVITQGERHWLIAPPPAEHASVE